MTYHNTDKINIFILILKYYIITVLEFLIALLYKYQDIGTVANKSFMLILDGARLVKNRLDTFEWEQ